MGASDACCRPGEMVPSPEFASQAHEGASSAAIFSNLVSSAQCGELAEYACQPRKICNHHVFTDMYTLLLSGHGIHQSSATG